MANPSDWLSVIDELQEELEETCREALKKEHPFEGNGDRMSDEEIQVRRILNEIAEARAAFDQAELEDDAGYMILPKKKS